MITDEMVVAVGRLFKPHSFRGEVNADILYGRELFADPNTPFFVKIDNILVPFFVETVGGGSNKTSFLKFRGIDSDSEASMVVNKELYALKSFVSEILGVSEEELEAGADDFAGFLVTDASNGVVIGEVEGIEEGVEYDYLLVKKQIDGETIHVPLIEEFVSEILEPSGESPGEITVTLPEGFLEI